jgi:hypothetical protein
MALVNVEMCAPRTQGLEQEGKIDDAIGTPREGFWSLYPASLRGGGDNVQEKGKERHKRED